MSGSSELPRASKGKRPHFFDDSASDHLLAMVLELAAELNVVYARIDTLERVLADATLLDRTRLQNYTPSQDAEDAREAWRDALLQRLFQTVRAEAVQGIVEEAD
jgi:hypothetical protein